MNREPATQKLRPTPLESAAVGDYVTLIDLLSAGGRFSGEKLDRKDGHFKYCAVRDMQFEIEHGPEGSFYKRVL